MKKFILVLLACLLLVPSAEARHWGRHHGWHRGGYYAADITAGIVGTTAGVLLAEQIMHPQRSRPAPAKPKVFVVEPEGKCYTIVSRKTGKITQQCVENASSDIIYID